MFIEARPRGNRLAPPAALVRRPRSSGLVVLAFFVLPIALRSVFPDSVMADIFLVPYFGLFLSVTWGFEWGAVLFALAFAPASTAVSGIPLSLGTGLAAMEMLLFAKACFFLKRKTQRFVGIAPLSYIFAQFTSCLFLGMLARISPSATAGAFFTCLLQTFPGSMVLLLINLITVYIETETFRARPLSALNEYFPVN